MDIDGYMVRVSFDGTTLTAEGKNKAAQIALRGQERNEGPVVVPVDQIERVEFKPANPMVNGRVTVHTTDGRKYLLHFRRKDREAFGELARALGVSDQPG